jgi:hypothetical protein
LSVCGCPHATNLTLDFETVQLHQLEKRHVFIIAMALACCAAELTVRLPALAADPSSASLQRDVWVSMWRLAELPDTGVTWQQVVAAMEDMLDTKNLVRSENTVVPIIREIMVATTMSSLFVALFALLASSFRTRAALQAEILALRHQLAVFQKNAPRRLRLHRCDRLFWVVLHRFWSGWRRCLEMVQPDTVVRWHRQAFAWHWTRKSRRLPGRPEVAANIRDLIRRMSQANPLWGAPRIHGELLKLGIVVAQSTVARYLPRSRKPPSQTWRTFLRNHLAQTAAIDFFTVPTATFRVCIPKTPSGGFPSNVTLLLPDRLLDPGSSSLPACH